MTNKVDIINKFGGRLRLRVCGLCWKNNALLLIEHHNMGEFGKLYAPPGGEAEFGSSMQANLVREFKEETNLEIKVGNFSFMHEFIRPPLHAIELFYTVVPISGHLLAGNDPELPANQQIIAKAKFMTWPAIKALPAQQLHQSLRACNTLDQFLTLQGQLKFDT